MEVTAQNEVSPPLRVNGAKKRVMSDKEDITVRRFTDKAFHIVQGKGVKIFVFTVFFVGSIRDFKTADGEFFTVYLSKGVLISEENDISALNHADKAGKAVRRNTLFMVSESHVDRAYTA